MQHSLSLPLGRDRVRLWCFSVASSNRCRAAGRGSESGIEAGRHRIGAVTGAARLKPSCELRSSNLIQPRRSLIVHCFGVRVTLFSLILRVSQCHAAGRWTSITLSSGSTMKL